MPITVLTDPGYKSPEVTVAEARDLMNRTVEKLQRQNGIDERSNRSIAEASELIKALTYRRPIGGDALAEEDELLFSTAKWNEPCLLTTYLSTSSQAYQRDHNQYGVYAMYEMVDGREVPVYVEAIPRYIGMSTLLASRLRGHAAGNPGSNPADRVMLEWMLANATHTQRKAYAAAPPATQREFRRMAIEQRKLWVRTTHTRDRASANRLEHAVTRSYERRGFRLWNKHLFTTVV